MPQCQYCSFDAKNAGGLSSHERACKRKQNIPMVNDTSDSVVSLSQSSTCSSCQHFPVGSAELVSMLLILVFSLSAVLVTSVWALNNQATELAQLQAQVEVQQD